MVWKMKVEWCRGIGAMHRPSHIYEAAHSRNRLEVAQATFDNRVSRVVRDDRMIKDASRQNSLGVLCGDWFFSGGAENCVVSVEGEDDEWLPIYLLDLKYLVSGFDDLVWRRLSCAIDIKIDVRFVNQDFTNTVSNLVRVFPVTANLLEPASISVLLTPRHDLPIFAILSSSYPAASSRMLYRFCEHRNQCYRGRSLEAQ